MGKGFVHYCCVAKGGVILQSYNSDSGSNICGQDLEIEKFASLCLEKVPQYHKWYSQTMKKRTYCYLIEDGFVYFAIAENGLGNQALIGFLEHYRDEFKKVVRRNSGTKLSWKGKRKGNSSNSNLNSVNMQEQLVPIVRQLITSLQTVGQSRDDNDSRNGNAFNRSSSPCGGSYGEVVEGSGSTKAPLLGVRPEKQEKRSKDHVIGMRGIEVEGQCRSFERGGRADTSSERRLSSQTMIRKWWRLVQVVIAIDAVVCIVLLVIWLVICRGIECIR